MDETHDNNEKNDRADELAKLLTVCFDMFSKN